MSKANHKSCRVSQITSRMIPSRFVFAVNLGAATPRPYLFLPVLLSSIFTGCIYNPVQSLNPFYTEEAVAELPFFLKTKRKGKIRCKQIIQTRAVTHELL